MMKSFFNKIKSVYKPQFKNFSLFIKSVETPNPKFRKFYPGVKFVNSRPNTQVSSPKEAKNCQIALKLFGIPGIMSVFVGTDYLSIGIDDENYWHETKPEVVDILADHFLKNEDQDLFTEDEDGFNPDEVYAQQMKDYSEEEKEICQFIDEIIKSRIRPNVNEDGGDINFLQWDKDDGTCQVKLSGSCTGCPSSSTTLKLGVEKLLMFQVPEVTNCAQIIDDAGEEDSNKL